MGVETVSLQEPDRDAPRRRKGTASSCTGTWERVRRIRRLALANSDGEIEDCSWRIFFGANGSGFICNDETMILQGLLELEGIRQIWMDHTRDGHQL